jgi:hypothetical protein
MATCNMYDGLMWLSHARGRLESSVAAEMELHAASCEECAKSLEFSRKFAAIMDLNSADPPDSWIEEAAAKFEFIDPDMQPSELFGDLVFDSYLHDREAIRSGSEIRHLVFDLPTFEIDLALEYSGRQINMIMGHLLSKTTEQATVIPGFSLELKAPDRTYSTKPNQFGEFSFSIASETTREPLELRCAFEEGPCAVILIPC